MAARIIHWIGSALPQTVLLLALLAAAPAQAQDPFYFIAKRADHLSPGTVMLRWDLAEGGGLPADIQRFQVLRNGTPIAERPAAGHLPVAEVNALYRLPGASRHYLDTYAALKQVARDTPSVPDFAADGFVPAVIAQIERDPTWALLAARRDPVLALARHRGVLDSPPPGAHEYELQAINAAGVSRRVGLLQLDTRQDTQLLAPLAFRQVVHGECDTLEAGRDHASIGLTWQAPGESVTDRLATQLFTAGYWVYRGRQPLAAGAALPERDLAREARNAALGPDGRHVFDGLELASDVLMAVDGDPTGAAVYVETRHELERVGLRPGDRRAYYLVAQDFTGALGPTVGAVVAVGDVSRPPAPQDVNVYLDAAEPGLELRWPVIGYDSYADLYVGRQRICNAADARRTGRLRLVGPNELCETGVPRELRLDVAGYRIYRFERFEDASRFVDHDGDGIADWEERQAVAEGRAPAGAQCNAQVRPAGATSALVGDSVAMPTAVQVVNPDNAPYGQVRFRDTVPAQDSGSVYWYVVHSVTAEGRVSLPSRPIRGLHPDRRLPAAPDVDVRTRVEQGLCDCELEVRDADRPWKLEDAVRVQSAPEIGLQCTESGSGRPVIESFSGRPFHSIASADGDICQAVASGMSCDTADLFFPMNPDGKTPVLCQVRVPESVDFCRRGEVVVRPVNCSQQSVPPGDVVSGPALVAIDSEPGTCISLWQRIGETDARVATSCDTDAPERLEHVVHNETFCGYAQAHDGNNNVSPRAPVPCVVSLDATAGTPLPPQPVSLGFFGDLADLRWRLPPEAIAVTMVELRRDLDGHLLLQGVAKSDIATGEDERADLPLPPSQVAGERWCARLRTVLPAPTGGVAAQSEWTVPICAERESVTPPVPYLPWPVVPPAPQLAPLVAEAVPAVGAARPVLRLTEVSGLRAPCVFSSQAPAGAIELEVFCQQEGIQRIRAAMVEWSHFIVYRQSRAADGREGPYLQVSPLIDRIHWEDALVKESFELNDPYLRLQAVASRPDVRTLVFEDRHPYFEGHALRYQVVLLDAQNRIRAWRQSDWLPATASGVTP